MDLDIHDTPAARRCQGGMSLPPSFGAPALDLPDDGLDGLGRRRLDAFEVPRGRAAGADRDVAGAAIELALRSPRFQTIVRGAQLAQPSLTPRERIVRPGRASETGQR